MARTKQTAKGAKANQLGRQEGMERAVLAPPAPQHKEVPQEGEEAQAGAEEEAQAAAEVEAQAGAEEVEVVQPEEQVTAEQDPVDPASQPGTSTATTPHSSASSGAAETIIYINKCQGFAKTWFEEVVKKKEQAYHDLIASLVGLAEEQSKAKDRHSRFQWSGS